MDDTKVVLRTNSGDCESEGTDGDELIPISYVHPAQASRIAIQYLVAACPVATFVS
jgi:hypothetical protein